MTADDAPEGKVWRFHEAPECYKNLSSNGGDEDWVIVVTPAQEELGGALAQGLAVCDYERCEYTNEYDSRVIVFITSHA